MLAKLTLRRRWQLSIILGISLMLFVCSGLWWWSGLPDRQQVYMVAAVGPLEQVAISPDSQFVATAAEDGTIQLWYLRDGAPLHTLSGHVRSAAIAFHPDSSQLVSAGADGTVRLWQVATGQTQAVLWPSSTFIPPQTESTQGSQIKASDPLTTATYSPVKNNDPFTTVAFSPDGQYIIAGTSHGWAMIFQIITGQVVNIIQAYPELAERVSYPMRLVSVSPNNQWLITEALALRIWHLPEGQLIKDFKSQPGQRLPFTPGLGVFAPDNALLWLFYEGDPELFTTPLIWSLDQQVLMPVPSGIKPTDKGFFEPNYAMSAAISNDRQLLAFGSGIQHAPANYRIPKFLEGNNPRILVFQAAQAQPQHTLLGHDDNVTDLAFSADAQFLASVGLDGTLRLWRIENP
jgi:WD40 repeat protein